MGVLTNAILCYGIELDEEKSYPWDNFDKIGDWWEEGQYDTKRYCLPVI
jgi:hypothetical protein